MNIGVIAGAFDPIHKGHLRFIDQSIDKYGLEKVFIILEEKSKFKKSFANFRHRQRLIEISIEDKAGVELYPAKTPSFPISSTLPELKAKYPAKFYLLVGNDVEEHIKTWGKSNELLKNVRLIVADRNGTDAYKKVSSGKVRQQIKTGADKVDLPAAALNYCRLHNLYR